MLRDGVHCGGDGGGCPQGQRSDNDADIAGKRIDPSQDAGINTKKEG